MADIHAPPRVSRAGPSRTALGSAGKHPLTAPTKSRHELLDEALDQALADTFPASDPVAVLEPVPETPRPRPRTH